MKKFILALLASLSLLVATATLASAQEETGPGSRACFEANKAWIDALASEKAYKDSEGVKLPDLQATLVTQQKIVADNKPLLDNATETAKPYFQKLIDDALKVISTTQAQIKVISDRSDELAANSKAAGEIAAEKCKAAETTTTTTPTTVPAAPADTANAPQIAVLPNVTEGVDTGEL